MKHAVLRQRHSTQVNFKWTNFIARSFVAVILIALIFRKVLSIEIFAKFCTAYTMNTLTKLKSSWNHNICLNFKKTREIKYTYLKNPLLSSCSAKLLIEDIKTSSYPKNVLRINLEKESPKQVSVFGSNTTISTEMFNFRRVAGDNLRNPYSKLYSTIYSSSGKKGFF